MKNPTGSAQSSYLVYVSGVLSGLLASACVNAAGISIQHGNGHQGTNPGHYRGHATVGKVVINRQSPRSFSHRYGSNTNTYSRYHSFKPPRINHYNYGNKQSFPDSRFPNSYRNQSNYYGSPAYRYNQNGHALNAWHLLAHGQTRHALTWFGTEARSHPGTGHVEIGYALSLAASGDLRHGISAMRHAFGLEADSLRYYHLDPVVRPLLPSLLSRYQRKHRRRGHRQDEAFMVSALYYLNQDYSAAYHALQRAEREGDRSRSLNNLKCLLTEDNIATGN